MVKDGVYSGRIRGRTVPDLQRHFEDSIAYAESERTRYIQKSVRTFGHPFARVPLGFWLTGYLILIVGFEGQANKYTQYVTAPAAFLN